MLNLHFNCEGRNCPGCYVLSCSGVLSLTVPCRHHTFLSFLHSSTLYCSALLFPKFHLLFFPALTQNTNKTTNMSKKGRPLLRFPNLQTQCNSYQNPNDMFCSNKKAHPNFNKESQIDETILEMNK